MKKQYVIIGLIAALLFVSFSSAFVFSQQKGEKTEKATIPERGQEEKKAPTPKEKTFEDVIKDAVKLEGLFTLYKKDDKLYLEILPEQFGRMYLYIPTQWTSVGFGGAGSYLDDQVFVWERLDKKVLLVWKNTRYVAKKSSECWG